MKARRMCYVRSREKQKYFKTRKIANCVNASESSDKRKKSDCLTQQLGDN